MHVFINFWKLEIKNSLLHVFSFIHKLNFENNFCFLLILSCQTSFLVLKIENCFWKQKIKGKNSYQTYPKLPVGSKNRKWLKKEGNHEYTRTKRETNLTAPLGC